VAPQDINRGKLRSAKTKLFIFNAEDISFTAATVLDTDLQV
jgi:hypothetical protein